MPLRCVNLSRQNGKKLGGKQVTGVASENMVHIRPEHLLMVARGRRNGLKRCIRIQAQDLELLNAVLISKL